MQETITDTESDIGLGSVQLLCKGHWSHGILIKERNPENKAESVSSLLLEARENCLLLHHLPSKNDSLTVLALFNIPCTTNWRFCSTAEPLSILHPEDLFRVFNYLQSKFILKMERKKRRKKQRKKLSFTQATCWTACNFTSSEVSISSA